VALLAGYLSGSIALVGFGLDSLMESLSGGVMIWRFIRTDLSAEEEAGLERRAVKIIGYTFLSCRSISLYESGEISDPGEILLSSLLGSASPWLQPGDAGALSF
jgi:hypothetical protein